MLNSIQNFIYPRIVSKSFENDDEIYLYLVMQVATVFAGTIHVILAILFAFSEYPILFYTNISSIIIYSLLYILVVKKRTYSLAGFIINIEVTLYTLFFSYLAGIDNYVIMYLVVVALMQVIIPYTHMYLRVALTVAAYSTALLLVYIQKDFVPEISLGSMKMAITVFNISVAFIGTSIELLLSSLIKNAIALISSKRMDELTKLANTDSLTGLYNRRYAKTLFSNLNSDSPSQWSIALLDIDNFKTINDKYGHNIGDKVLTSFAKELKNALGSSNIVIRWGGEEFLIVMKNTDVKSAYAIIDSIRHYISCKKLEIENICISYTITAGLAPLNFEDVEQSIDQCDRKMYQGKNAGKNIVVA